MKKQCDNLAQKERRNPTSRDNLSHHPLVPKGYLEKSKKMKTLVIPDIHQEVDKVSDVLLREEYDEAVFLGDWVDSLKSPPLAHSFYGTCVFLRKLMTDHPRSKDFVFLLGNHDLQYIHLNHKPSRSSVVAERAYYCSGFSKNKARDWRKVFYDEGLRDDFFWKRFHIAHISQGFTFSHAGVSERHLSYGETIREFVEKSCQEAWHNYRQLSHPKNYILTDVGACRGGSSQIGCPLWLDWREEFVASSFIGSQVVGHTTVSEPSLASCTAGYSNWNLDTERHYALISDKEVVIKLYRA